MACSMLIRPLIPYEIRRKTAHIDNEKQRHIWNAAFVESTIYNIFPNDISLDAAWKFVH